MRNAIEMLRRTPTPILRRAKSCVLTTFTVTEDYDELGRPHAYIVSAITNPPPVGSGKLHRVEARLYNPHGSNSPSWISCDCGNFRYTWEVALMLPHSSSVRYSNGQLPKIRNPGKVTGLCKHVARLLSYATRSAKVRKVLYQTPTFRQLGLKRKVMKERGIPEKIPKSPRPTIKGK